MKITFDHIIPEPLLNLYSNDGEIWNKKNSIESNRIVHVCAPSGSGKTTLIHLMYGLRTDYSGKLFFNEMEVSSFSEEEWQKLRLDKVSVIFQDLKLFEDLSAWENIVLKNQLTNHLSFDEIKLCAQKLGVDHLLEKKIKHISRGERQRIAIIRSLCMPFQWLLMDEPFSHLDHKNSQLAADLILEHAIKNNGGVLMANLEIDQWFPYHVKLKLN